MERNVCGWSILLYFLKQVGSYEYWLVRLLYFLLQILEEVSSFSEINNEMVRDNEEEDVCDLDSIMDCNEVIRGVCCTALF